MKFTLEIDCSNAAFGDDFADASDQAALIIHKLAQRMSCNSEAREFILRDSNGNRVGVAKFEATP